MTIEQKEDPESWRIHQWRMGLIADLSEDMRDVLRHLYPNRHGLKALIAVLRKESTSSVLVQGMLVYWEYLADYFAMVARRELSKSEESDPWKDQQDKTQPLP